MAFFTVEAYTDRYARTCTIRRQARACTRTRAHFEFFSPAFPLPIPVCSFKAVIHRLDAIIRLAAAARSWAISERCIKYLALLASKVFILAAASTSCSGTVTCISLTVLLASSPRLHFFSPISTRRRRGGGGFFRGGGGGFIRIETVWPASSSSSSSLFATLFAGSVSLYHNIYKCNYLIQSLYIL